jgi:hypothetical protein
MDCRVKPGNDECLASFRDAPQGAGPESIRTMVVMDSGLTLRAPRNDESGGYTSPPPLVTRRR